MLTIYCSPTLSLEIPLALFSKWWEAAELHWYDELQGCFFFRNSKNKKDKMMEDFDKQLSSHFPPHSQSHKKQTTKLHSHWSGKPLGDTTVFHNWFSNCQEKILSIPHYESSSQTLSLLMKIFLILTQEWGIFFLPRAILDIYNIILWTQKILNSKLSLCWYTGYHALPMVALSGVPNKWIWELVPTSANIE